MSYSLLRCILISLNLLPLFTAAAPATQVKCELSLQGARPSSG